MDRTYMGQLVAVQHRRGASNGHAFAEALGLGLAAYAKERTDAERAEEQERRNEAVRIGSESHQVSVIPPRPTALIPPGQVKPTLMHLFDIGSPSRMTMKEKRDAFRTLQKFLAAEISGGGATTPLLDALVKALDQIMKSEHKGNFSTALARRPSFSCALVRLIKSALTSPGGSTSLMNLMVKTAGNILEHLRAKEEKQSPLIMLLEGFNEGGAGGGGGRSGGSQPSSPSPAKSPRKKGDKRRRKDDEDEQQQAEMRRNLERDIHAKVEEALRKKNTRPLVNEMANLLLKEEDGEAATKRQASSLSSSVSEAAASKAGLFVDWLEMLDPELIQLDQETKQQLLFSKCLVKASSGGGKKRKEEKMVAPSARRSRPYLLTMLTHQSSWENLRSVVSRVLERHNENLEASAVLDFLAACSYIPKLWHGVDTKHRPKHAAPPDMLDLNDEQIRVLVEYHLAEVNEKKCRKSEDTDAVFRGRMGLLMQCLSTRQKANASVEHLFWKIVGQGETDSSRKTARRLLLQIYMMKPSCLVHLQTGGLLDSQDLLPSRLEPPSSKGASSAGGASTLDAVTHTLISALAATQHGRQWAAQMLEFEAAARKVAACHPILTLRNLTLVSASLKGRTEYDFSFFRSRNHLTLFSMALGLLDVLRPHVFRLEHRRSLEETLVCYFDMLTAYFNRRDSFIGVIDKFLTFLNDYLEAEPLAAAEFIRKHGSNLPDMQRALPNLASLKALVTNLNLESSSSSSSTAAAAGSASSGAFSQQARRDAAAEGARLLAALQSAKSNEEVAAALKDANEACQGGSGARASILEHLAPEICSYASHPCRQVRAPAHNLMLKCMRFSPRTSVTREIATSYVRCLESRDPSVAQAALEKMPDVVVLAQESLVDIMAAAFNLGIHGGMNVTQYITDTIGVLNTSLGY